MSLAATATMVLMLLLLPGFWIVQTGLLASLSYVEEKVEVVADIQDTATQAQIDEVTARLQVMPEVALDRVHRQRTRRSAGSARRVPPRASRTSPSSCPTTRCRPASR